MEKVTLTAAEIVETYAQTDSIRGTAKALGIGHQIVRRTLITEGVIVTERSEQISELKRSGKTDEEIAQLLGITAKSVRQHLPYVRKSYRIGEKTKNAQTIAKFRKKKSEKP